ncbi:MAG: class I SAM-dependent RNA methyltransferase [Polyangiaceae bacterium]
MARPLQLGATVGALAPGGHGVAHVELGGERRAVFLPGTAPGDVVRAEIDASRRPARGRVLEWIERSPDRVEPACRWAERCGGCDWMHLSLDAQARAHAEHVRAALPAAWRETPIAGHPAVAALGYRLRARVHVRCERGRVEVGMHEAGTRDQVAVDACAVLEPELEAARRLLASLFEGSRSGGDVQLARGTGRRPVLEVRWTGEVAPACFARLEHAVDAGELAGARVWMGDASRPAVVGDPTPWMTGGDGQPLRLAPGGFGQANEAMNAVLARHVAGAARASGAERAVELYAGAGNLGVLVAREVRELVLVESSREACDAARANLAARALSARVVEADAAAHTWHASTRLVVLDPPRTGARAVCERLAGSRVPHVVYVSCDSQTLARDLAALAGSYAPRSVAAFEMFPQTSHVEVVVALERTAPRGRA